MTALRSQKLTQPLKIAVHSPLLPTVKEAAAVSETEISPHMGRTRTTATMSLYVTDLVQIKNIRRGLEDAGVKRVSDSEAVRVALRLVSLDKALLLKTYQSMAPDDGRKKQ